MRASSYCVQIDPPPRATYYRRTCGGKALKVSDKKQASPFVVYESAVAIAERHKGIVVVAAWQLELDL